MQEFEGIFRALASAEVEGIVVGGIAAAVHGAARPTRDIDFLYQRVPENYAKLVEALGTRDPYLRGAPPGLPFRFDAKTIESGGNFTLTTSIGDVDLLATIAGGDYDTLLPRTELLSLFGLTCRVLDLETLIRVKRAAGRPKDFEAIAELEYILSERGKE